jgi:hypothetical protein
VIKIDTNSIVQDASNQTDYNDDKDEEEEEEECTSEDVNDRDDEGESSKSEYEDDNIDGIFDKTNPSRNLKWKRKKTATSEKKVYNDANPDFAGLQILLNGIEKVERGENVTTNAEDHKIVKAGTSSDNDKDAEKPEVCALDGLEMLMCAAFQEQEKNSDESTSLSLVDDVLRDKGVLHKGSKICKFYF